jgi:hypothetical protein
MEQIGQFIVDSTAVCVELFASRSPTIDGVFEKLVHEASFLLLSEDSVLDEDEDGVGEPRYRGTL